MATIDSVRPFRSYTGTFSLVIRQINVDFLLETEEALFLYRILPSSVKLAGKLAGIQGARYQLLQVLGATSYKFWLSSDSLFRNNVLTRGLLRVNVLEGLSIIVCCLLVVFSKYSNSSQASPKVASTSAAFTIVRP